MSQPHLPVPSLEATLENLASCVGALRAETGHDDFRTALDEFARGQGPRLQQALNTFAQQENARGRSWLSSPWLEGYFSARTRLPLTSNVGFALNLPEEPGDPDQVSSLAARIHRIVAVHLEQARGETPQQQDPGGRDLDMGQVQVLAGGLRHPRPEVDAFVPPTQSAARREIGLILDTRLFALVVSDDDGMPLGVDRIAVGLRALPERHEATAQDAAAGGFAAMSYLGSEFLAPVLDEMLQDAENERTYRRLTDFLCTVTLAPVRPPERTEVAVDPGLVEVLTTPGRAWVYKPLSYQLDPRGNGAAVHVEHSMFDGGVLADAVGRMQQLPPAAGRGREPRQDAGDVGPEELVWNLEPEVAGRIDSELSEYRRAAGSLRSVQLHLPRVLDEQLPVRISLDALHQITLSVAQVLAYGRVRSAYESVDMRTFVAGRTECLRPVTPAAVAFAHALVADRDLVAVSDESLREQFGAVLEAHRTWVKACKTGAGMDRHLLGLQMMAQKEGSRIPLLERDDVTAVRTDFLSTTSLGDSAQVLRYAFAPTIPEGFGVCYTPYPDALSYLVTWDEATAEEPERFLEALREAAERIRSFLLEWAQAESTADRAS